MSSSRKGIHLLLALTIAHGIGIFLLWQQILTGILEQYSANRASSSLWRCGDNKSSTLLKPHHDVTWSDATTREEIIQKSLEKYKRTSSDQLDILRALGIEGVLQIIDPKGGRSWACLDAYFRNWTMTTKDILPRVPLFESFFEWLDNGTGRDIEIKTKSGKACRKNNNKAFKRYLLFNETERAKTEIFFDVDANGRISNMTFAYNETKPDSGMYVFVWGLDGKIYVRNEKKMEDDNNNNTSWGHASFFHGQPVRFAGEMQIQHSTNMTTIAWINDKSGNYKPSLSSMRNFYQFLRDEKGVNVTTIQWRRGRDALDHDWTNNLGKNSSLRSLYGKRVD